MSETLPPPGQRPTQPSPPTYQPYPTPQREPKPVSFYLAIFLGLLLFVSGGLNLLLLFVSALGSATSGFGAATEEDGMYEVVAVGGEPDAKTRLLRVPITGAIAEAGTPLIGAAGGTVSQVRRALKLAGRDDSIGGVLLDINSPGGGVTDSDEIWRAVRDFKKEHGKHVVALFGDVAASGGYYVAAACDRIIARVTSITGSIGVIMSAYNFEQGAQKLGISEVTILSKHTPYKDMLSPMRELRPDEREILESIVEEMYQRFVDVVADGRPELSRPRIVELADGRIYSAQQALDAGLIDEIGTADDAYRALRDLIGVETARVVEHRRRPTLAEILFGVRSRVPSVEAAAATLLHSTSGPRFLYFWPGGR